MTIQQLHDDICCVLLEPGGFTLGLVTEAQFLQYYRSVAEDFLGRSGLCKAIALVPQSYGQQSYAIPDSVDDVEAVWSDGTSLTRSSEGSVSSITRNWQQQIGPPRVFLQDKVNMQTMVIFPGPVVQNPLTPAAPAPPNFGFISAWVPAGDLTQTAAFIGTLVQAAGTATFTSPGAFFNNDAAQMANFWAGNVAMAGKQTLLTEAVGLGSLIESLTDDWVPFLKYGILARIFDSDSECRDRLRAQYCSEQYEEGIALAQAIMGEEVQAV